MGNVLAKAYRTSQEVGLLIQRRNSSFLSGRSTSNSSRIRLIAKESRFSGNLLRDGRVRGRLVEEMVYGIQARGSVRLSVDDRSLWRGPGGGEE